ncbi:MAG: ATP-binding protein, partial [Alphaproteobacteria bacterium]|nr:ATP-binding protein [Alphaproteobacteria bacterium]
MFVGVASAIVTPRFDSVAMPLWTPEQDQALIAVARWLETPRAPQVFR